MRLQLKDLRKKRGLSQEDLAELLDTNRSSISKIETTNKIPTIELLQSYSKEFKVSTDALLGLMDNYYEDIYKNSYYKGLSFKDMLDTIINDYLDRESRKQMIEDQYFSNERKIIAAENHLLEKYIQNLNILEDIKRKTYLVGVVLTGEEEEVITKVLDLILLKNNFKHIESLLIFLDNLDKLENITSKLVKQNDCRLKIILDILKEFSED